MPAARARQLVLAACDRHRLKRLERSQTAPYRQVLRAKIVLLAARGMPNARIAARLGITVDTARKWRGRFAAHELAGLADRPRAGRPSRFTPLQVAEVKALACQLPAEAGVPLSVWSCPELAREAVCRGITTAISASTVGRWLAEDAIKPWQHRSWIFIRDPDFGAKASRVLDLYARRWQGQPLGPDEYVLCADEKTSIQARCRCHPTLPPGKARTMRINHDYDRGGALAYLAAYDVGQAKVYGRCAPSTGIKPFMALVQQVMTRQPYASATRVFWIVDNGSSHRGQAAIDRLAKRFPNAVMIHTPRHASWLNQAEIYFSVVQRKVVAPNDFTSLDQVQQRLADFEPRYNATARPFQWKFTPTDLDDLLARIDRHQQTTAPTIPQAA
jgi:transposase